MIELCFNTMNRSAFFLGDESPDLPGQIEAARDAGFRLIGPDAFSIRHFREEGGSVEDLSSRIEAAGLETFELPTLMIGRDVSQLRREVDEMLAMAEVLRPRFVQVNVESEVDESLVAETRWSAERFAELGVGLAVEYLPWLPAIRSLESTRRLIDRVAHPGVGVLVDTWHFFHSDDTWEQLEALPLDEIAYLQFDDHPPLESDDLVAETVGRRVLPGEGVFELEKFCDVMRAKGFEGVVSCEILSDASRRMGLAPFARAVYESCSRYWL